LGQKFLDEGVAEEVVTANRKGLGRTREETHVVRVNL
jgi:hypothetical protein